jgi:formylmethanofuran--tetrahydromethanopterin N-formyltransferase
VFQAPIEDTYAEAFDGIFSRILVTGERGLTKKDSMSPYLEHDPLRCAAYRATATPSTVVGRVEGGIERWFGRDETPDKREGVVLQFWGAYNSSKPLEEQAKKFYKEVSIRVRQDILSAPGGTTRVFDLMRPEKSIYNINSEERVGKCGGGHETFPMEYEKDEISVPLMSGHDFKIDNALGVGLGISGANFWIMSRSVRVGRKAGKAAVEAIKKVQGVIMPFYLCPSGSSTDDYPPIGPPTNYQYCPTLRNKIPDSKVPEGVRSIPEIVIDGVDMVAVKAAMKEGISAARKITGVKLISAGNYEGKLGKYKIYLREL